MLLLGFYSGLSGYFLIWNQRAFWATKVFATFPGYMDQFGGPRGRRYKKQTFISLIESNLEKPLHEQKEIFEEEFNSWKDKREQIDDVLVLGVKLS